VATRSTTSANYSTQVHYRRVNLASDGYCDQATFPGGGTAILRKENAITGNRITGHKLSALIVPQEKNLFSSD
jgi:hypothetical protein